MRIKMQTFVGQEEHNYRKIGYSFMNINPDKDLCLNPTALDVADCRGCYEYFIHTSKNGNKILYKRASSLYSDEPTYYVLRGSTNKIPVHIYTDEYCLQNSIDTLKDAGFKIIEESYPAEGNVVLA